MVGVSTITVRKIFLVANNYTSKPERLIFNSKSHEQSYGEESKKNLLSFRPSQKNWSDEGQFGFFVPGV